MKYVARMNSWVHDTEYPITKTFLKKDRAMKYIKQALAIYPYVKITLYKYTNDGKGKQVGVYSQRRKK